MSRVDQDLEQAVAVNEARAAVRQTAPLDPDEPGAGAGRRLGVVLAVVAVGVVLVVLVLRSTEQAAIYSRGVDELVADQSRLVGRYVRAEGELVHGSLRRRQQPCEYRFSLTRNQATLEVRYPQCVVPDTFRDMPGATVTVTVEGRVGDPGTFLADRILPKCPSRYDMDRQSGGGARAPHPAGSRPSR